jgi:hypothetical protein
VKPLLGTLGALLLLAAPIAAAEPAQPPEGTVGVFVYRVVAGKPVQVGQPVIVLPPMCLPGGVS